MAGGTIGGTEDFVLKGDSVIVSQFVRDEQGRDRPLWGPGNRLLQPGIDSTAYGFW